MRKRLLLFLPCLFATGDAPAVEASPRELGVLILTEVPVFDAALQIFKQRLAGNLEARGLLASTPEEVKNVLVVTFKTFRSRTGNLPRHETERLESLRALVELRDASTGQVRSSRVARVDNPGYHDSVSPAMQALADRISRAEAPGPVLDPVQGEKESMGLVDGLKAAGAVVLILGFQVLSAWTGSGHR